MTSSTGITARLLKRGLKGRGVKSPEQIRRAGVGQLATARRLEYPLAVALLELVPPDPSKPARGDAEPVVKELRMLVPSESARDAEAIMERFEQAATGAETRMASPGSLRTLTSARESATGLQLPKPPRISLTEDGFAQPLLTRLLPALLQWIAFLEAMAVLAMLAALPFLHPASSHTTVVVGFVALMGLATVWLGADSHTAKSVAISIVVTGLIGLIVGSTTLAVLHDARVLVLLIPTAVGFLAIALSYLAADWRSQGLRAWLRQLELLSTTDQLTGLANRRACEIELLRRMRRPLGSGSLSVAFLDVDHFKQLNDAQGHQMGDRFLQETAAIWGVVVPDGALLARYGGEEFALVLDAPLEEAHRVVDHLRSLVPGGETASAGVAQWDGAEDIETLMKRVDAALYQAKLAGRNRTKLADRHWDSQAAMLSSHWQSVVERALENRSVIAVYQPIVRLDTQRVVGYEALARPNPLQPNISVERMFATAQRIGRARDLDWLCRRAALADAGNVPRGIPVFVNVSVSGLVDPMHGVDQLMLVLSWARRRAQDIVLEITEREVVRDLLRLQSVVEQYRQQGFRFAVDDVGEGHSTLEVLAAVSPDYVKIARSLVINADRVGERSAIRAVVAFARELGASVIAEGIETTKVATWMSDLGVDLAQGYLFGRPAALVATTVDEETDADEYVKLPSLSA